MKSKIFSLVLMTAILSLALVSAADFTISTSILSDLTKTDNSTSFSVTNPASNNKTLNIVITLPAKIEDNDNHELAISSNSVLTQTLAPGAISTPIEIIYTSTSSNLKNFALGTFSEDITIVATEQGNATNTLTETKQLNFVSGFCEKGNLADDSNNDNRRLEITSVSDKSDLDNDWEWKPLDELEIEVKVKFSSEDNNDDIDGIIAIALYDTVNNEFIDFEDGDTEIEFSLDEGDRTTETFTVKVPVEDLEESADRYKLYVKAYEDGDEDVLCTDKIDSEDFQDIEIIKESYMVVLTNIDISSPAPCGEEVEVTATVYNTGTHDEDKVKVRLENTELGLKLESDEFSLDEADSEKISFNFKIPDDAKEKEYTLKLYVDYRYSKSSEEYRETSDSFDIKLKVEGQCTPDITSSNVLITAELSSETPDAVAGQQVVIKATLRNIGTGETTYSVSLTDNSAWSSLKSIDPQVITLKSGESREVYITLALDGDAAGEKEFTIRASYDNTSTEQKVALTIKNTGSQSNIVEHLRNNWFIYLIVLVNIILIIAIISVIRKLSRPASL